MIDDDVNGVIVECKEECIYDAVKMLLDDNARLERIGNSSVKGELNKEEIMRQIEKLFI